MKEHIQMSDRFGHVRTKLSLTSILVVLAAMGVGLFLQWLFYDPIPPASMTELVLSSTVQRIREYTLRQPKLPAQLSDLPPTQSDRCTNSVIDGWGHPLIYKAEPDGAFQLGSEGKNEKDVVIVRFPERSQSTFETDNALVDSIFRRYIQNHEYR